MLLLQLLFPTSAILPGLAGGEIPRQGPDFFQKGLGGIYPGVSARGSWQAPRGTRGWSAAKSSAALGDGGWEWEAIPSLAKVTWVRQELPQPASHQAPHLNGHHSPDPRSLGLRKKQPQGSMEDERACP